MRPNHLRLLTALTCVIALPASAAAGPNNHGGATRPPQPAAAQTQHGGAQTTHSASSPVKTKTSSGSHAASSKTNAVTSPASSVGSGTTSGTTSRQLSPIARKISSHPQLASKVEGMLPDGMTLDRAARGFKNQGQFIAALHVSQNLGIPFKDLKADMTRKHMSLGQSIQDLKHSANSTTEAHRGEHEADEDVRHWSHSETREHEEWEHHHSISRQISSNPQLSAKVKTLLPSGMTLKQATSGFRSEEQFLAALHAAKDLGIPFTQIKSEMTGGDHDTLFRAIQELKPSVDAAAAVKTARAEAAADLHPTTTTTAATTTATSGQ